MTLDARSYLAGIIDGEGSVHHGKTARSIEVGNTDLVILHTTKVCCDVLSIEARINGPYQGPGNRKPYWKLLITGQENLRRVLAEVPIQAPAKRLTLQALVAGYQYGYVRKDRLPVAELQRLRAEGKTQRQIASVFGVHQGTICHWLRKAGVA